MTALAPNSSSSNGQAGGVHRKLARAMGRAVTDFDETRTFKPLARLRVARLLWELCRFVPVLLTVLIGLGVLILLEVILRDLCLWWTIGLSIMATQASAITFLSMPGQAYEDGMGFLQFYFGLPVAMVGTDFQRAVWKALREIPAGETWSYGRLAEHIGKPSAVRAVGLANGSNPISVVVPCHRVIGANGSLTGYAGGVERKKWLLEHESSSRTVSRPG